VRVAAATAALTLALAATPAAAQEPCTGDPPGGTPPAQPGGTAMRFGIYPGGVAGQLGPVPSASKPDDAAKIQAALADLRPASGPFVVHLYGSYLDDATDAKEQQRLANQLARYSALGYQVEFVMRYRRDNDVAGYTAFIRGVVRRFGPNPAFTGLQVTNEVNFTASKDSSDGGYEGSRDALIQGVIAAKDEARKAGASQLEIGFNWVHRTDPGNEDSFWSYLGSKGGAPFAAAVDWIGLDVYPGTFFPPAGGPAVARDTVLNALSSLRRCYLPKAGLAAAKPIHIAESGYPTGTGRSYEDQKSVLEIMIGTVNEYRRDFNVSDYRWFDLRDADTASPNFQQQYGLMRDDYTPKPAYASYRRLVDELSLRAAGGGQGGTARKPRLVLRLRCSRRGLRQAVHGRDVALVRRVEFRARGRKAGDRARPFRATLKLPPRRRTRAAVVVRMRDGRRLVYRGRARRC
jgi:hypothetical protein